MGESLFLFLLVSNSRAECGTHSRTRSKFTSLRCVTPSEVYPHPPKPVGLAGEHGFPQGMRVYQVRLDDGKATLYPTFYEEELEGM